MTPAAARQARRDRFGAEHGFTAEEVHHLTTLAGWCARANEGECNGDPHADSTNRQDKNKNAKCWAADLARNTNLIERIAQPKGFTVEYTGLRPHLKKNGEYVEIPHD